MSADRTDLRPTGRSPRHSSSFAIGRIAGIEIRVHWTFFLLVALFALGSSGPRGPGVVAGLFWLVVIFGCVVAHELAHCVVARRRGATVREIVLLPIGGVSKLENLPESPPDEFAIAIVGPAASLGIAGAAAIVALGVGQPLLPIDLYNGALLARLVWFNLIVAGFNLLPAFPLDGGRVFRALLERRYDLEHATRVAARIGRALAVALIAVGVLVNFWLVIIGVFVYFGASAEEAATIAHVRLRGAHVADVMLLEPVVIDPATTVADLRVLVRRTTQRALPVVGPGGYVGIVDAMTLGHISPGMIAAEIAAGSPALSPSANLEREAFPLVASAPLHALPVVDDGHVIGLLRLEDIQRLLVELDHPRAGRHAEQPA